MSSLKLKSFVDSKNYVSIRKLNLKPKTRFLLKNYAVKRKALSIATLLNSIPKYEKSRFRVRESSIVKLYVNYFNKYLKCEYTAIGNAAKIISFFLYSLVPKKDLLGDNIYLYGTQSFTNIKQNDIDEKVFKKFKKIRQWPHLTLMLFPTYNSGSCHDQTLLRAMLLEKQNKNYKLEISTGTNTLLSHVNLRIVQKLQTKREKMFNFLLMTLFHTFRTHQTLKFISKNTKKLRKLENTLYSILYKCTNNEDTSLHLLQYLLTRRHNSFEKIKKNK